MNTQVIGIAGFARTGKDTFAKIILDYYERKGRIFKFANSLKEELDVELQNDFGISAFTEHPDEKRAIRGRLVEYGEKKRSINKNYFVEKTKAQIELYSIELDEKGETGISIVPDVRFQNEVECIRDLGGVVIHLDRVEDGNFMIGPANQLELQNSNVLRAMADFNLIWGPNIYEGTQFVVENFIKKTI